MIKFSNSNKLISQISHYWSEDNLIIAFAPLQDLIKGVCVVCVGGAGAGVRGSAKRLKNLSIFVF